MAKQTNGFIFSVPCPHCDNTNDFRNLHQDMGAGYGLSGLETGTKVDCDHCKRHAVITGVFHDPYVNLGGAGKKVGGPISAVPCPHCNAHQDFRSVANMLGDLFEKGVKANCDKCDGESTVLAVIKQPRIRLAAQ